MPRVAVITAVHNGARFVAETVRSVLAQTYRDYEHIVVDDGSTDESMSALEPFGNQIRVIGGPNRGQAEARNRALEASDAELVAVLDHDDVWEPTKLAEQIRLFDTGPSLGLVSTAHLRVDELGRPLRRQPRIHRDPELLPYLLTARDPVAFSSVVLRRSLLGSDLLHDPRFPHTGDLHLFFRILRTGAGFYNVPFRLLRYRVHARALTAVALDASTYFREIEMFLDQAFGDERVARVYGHLRPLSEAYACYFRGRIELAHGASRRAARRHLWEALGHSQAPEIAARVTKYLAVSFLPRCMQLEPGASSSLGSSTS